MINPIPHVAVEEMPVNFTKPMIDLVRELRKRAPIDAKPSIKLANPELLIELIPWYRQSGDAVVKALIKELFSLAGDDWPDRLADPMPASDEADPIASDGKRYVTRVYRGQTQLVEASSPQPKEKPATQRVYRGQIVQ